MWTGKVHILNICVPIGSNFLLSILCFTAWTSGRSAPIQSEVYRGLQHLRISDAALSAALSAHTPAERTTVSFLFSSPLLPTALMSVFFGRCFDHVNSQKHNQSGTIWDEKDNQLPSPFKYLLSVDLLSAGSRILGAHRIPSPWYTHHASVIR